MPNNSESPGLTGSFSSLNNSLSNFAPSTTASAPPDGWVYSPTYDLMPHHNLLSSSNSPYSNSFGRAVNNGYTYATMLPQHDASLSSVPTGNLMRIHQDYTTTTTTTTTNDSPPLSLGRSDYHTTLPSHSPPTHLGNFMPENDNRKQLDYVGGDLGTADKYQREQSNYSQQRKSEYEIHHSPSGRISIKHQMIIKSEPTNQSYVQLPPFLN